jgi:hypothetical protein
MVVELHQPNADKKPIGMHVIPATGREFFWTGKVAIGIRHEQPPEQPTHGEVLIQTLMLRQALRS